MRRLTVVLIGVVVLLFLSFNSFASQLIKGKLDNGLSYRIYVKSSLPIVSVDLKIKGGSIFDPVGKFGLAYITAHSLENCATKDLTADQLRKLFDKYGIESSISVTKGYVDIRMTSLTSDVSVMFKLLNEILHSKFDPSGISFVKREAINKILALKNDKDYLAIHGAFVGLIEQRSISHTSIGDVQGIKAITRDDVINFFKKYFVPNNMVISVSGGFSPIKVVENIKRYLGGLKLTSKKERTIFEAPIFRKGLIVSDIIKPQTKQSYIYFAFPSFGCCTIRYYASRVLANIFGGGLNSILSKDIRTEHGYAYSVFAFEYELPKRGVFVIGLQTQNKYTLNAIKRVFSDIKDIETYITPKRVKMAKDYLEGSVPIALQSSQAIASSLSYAYFKGVKELPWLHFEKGISSVTVKDVKEIAREILKKGSLSIGIVSYKKFSRDIRRIAKNYGY